MRKSLLVLLLLFLAGCATTVAPPYSYSPDQGDGAELVIGARAVNGIVTDKIFITINDEDVLFGTIALWRLTESLSGSYRGRQVEANCFAINDGIKTLTRHFCTVFIEGEKITRLAF